MSIIKHFDLVDDLVTIITGTKNWHMLPDTIRPEWILIAIEAETGELINSLPWKWWTTKIPDLQNIRIEIVDIWHFVVMWFRYYEKHFVKIKELKSYMMDVKLYVDNIFHNAFKDRDENCQLLTLDDFKSKTPQDLRNITFYITQNLHDMSHDIRDMLEYDTIITGDINYFEDTFGDPLINVARVASIFFKSVDDFDHAFKKKLELNIERQKKGYKHDESVKYINGHEDNRFLQV